MNNILDKELIKKRFEKSLSTYADNAFIQKQMAANLISKLIENQGNNFDNILEIGCGCGFLTDNILNSLTFKTIFVNDIVEKAVNKTAAFSPKIKKIYGDCENVTFPDNLDLVISNATFQWLFDFETQLSKVYSSLNPDGIFAFTTFGELNLNQIKILTGQSLKYYEKTQVEKLLNENFEIIYSSSEIVNIEFDSAFDILRHLKLSGVNSLEEIKWGKKDLESFIEKYDKSFKNNNGKLELTYQPLYFITRKRGKIYE